MTSWAMEMHEFGRGGASLLLLIGLKLVVPKYVLDTANSFPAVPSEFKTNTANIWTPETMVSGGIQEELSVPFVP